MEVVSVTKETYPQEVLESEKPVLLDFWAPWCGPCQMLAPALEEIAAERPDIKVCKINVDEEKELARQHKVMGIPTLMVFRNGVQVTRTTGGKNKDQVLELLDVQ